MFVARRRGSCQPALSAGEDRSNGSETWRPRRASDRSRGRSATSSRRWVATSQAGCFPAGAVLPAEPDLERHYGVSRGVVREAVKVLAGKGPCQRRTPDRHARTAETGLEPARPRRAGLARPRRLRPRPHARPRRDAPDHRAGCGGARGRTREPGGHAGHPPRLRGDGGAITVTSRERRRPTRRSTSPSSTPTGNPVLASFRTAIDAILSAVFEATVPMLLPNLPNHEAVAAADRAARSGRCPGRDGARARPDPPPDRGRRDGPSAHRVGDDVLTELLATFAPDLSPAAASSSRAARAGSASPARRPSGASAPRSSRPARPRRSARPPPRRKSDDRLRGARRARRRGDRGLHRAPAAARRAGERRRRDPPRRRARPGRLRRRHRHQPHRHHAGLRRRQGEARRAGRRRRQPRLDADLLRRQPRARPTAPRRAASASSRRASRPPGRRTASASTRSRRAGSRRR